MKLTNKRNLQLIPILDLKGATPLLSSSFYFRYAGSQDIPIIGYKLSTYPNANKGYDMMRDDLDKIHEDDQGSCMYNTQIEDFRNRFATFISGCNVVYIYI